MKSKILECPECKDGEYPVLCACLGDYDCSRCDNTGWLYTGIGCQHCNGTGFAAEKKIIRIETKKHSKFDRAIFSMTIGCPSVELIFSIEIFGYCLQVVKG